MIGRMGVVGGEGFFSGELIGTLVSFVLFVFNSCVDLILELLVCSSVGDPHSRSVTSKCK